MRAILQFVLLFAACCLIANMARAQGLNAPSNAVAGSDVSLPTTGSGRATLYVFGPGTAIKKHVQLGTSIPLPLKHAGLYTAIVNGHATTFDVAPGAVSSIAFLAHPSRVPADVKNVIAGTVFIFDKNGNLVTKRMPVKFDLSVHGAKPESHVVQAKDGVAYIKLDSGHKAGPAQFVASVAQTSVRRVVEETAADPCNLRMHVHHSKDGLVVATDPIRDCAGNPVPDGTIVSFTATSKAGRDTVDARIKKGIAQAELPPLQDATLSVASGVVVGNEIRVGGGM